MAQKNNQAEGQQSLFDESGSPYDTQVPESSTMPYPISYGPEGSFVNISKRAELLNSSLVALGKRNQRLGFDVASQTKPFSSPIWGRYEDLTPLVVEGAQRKAENFLDIAKQDFWAATGFTALRALGLRQGLMTSDQIDSRGRKMWREFTRKYGDPEVRAKRDKYKKQLQRSVKNQAKLSG